MGFSAVASIKTKYRSKLDIENVKSRVAISQLCIQDLRRSAAQNKPTPVTEKTVGLVSISLITTDQKCSFLGRSKFENLLKADRNLFFFKL